MRRSVIQSTASTIARERWLLKAGLGRGTMKPGNGPQRSSSIGLISHYRERMVAQPLHTLRLSVSD
jgi:hypothetical protein